MPDATLMIVRDGNGQPDHLIVVTHADPVIWVAAELWRHICDPNRTRIPGDAETDGELLTFGTPGEGLGRLTYRMIGRTAEGHHVAELVTEETPDA